MGCCNLFKKYRIQFFLDSFNERVIQKSYIGSREIQSKMYYNCEIYFSIMQHYINQKELDKIEDTFTLYFYKKSIFEENLNIIERYRNDNFLYS
jgi:hypothetical protein